MKYKIIDTGEDLQKRGRRSAKLIAVLINRNKYVPYPAKIKNPKIAANVQMMHEKWLARRAE